VFSNVLSGIDGRQGGRDWRWPELRPSSQSQPEAEVAAHTNLPVLVRRYMDRAVPSGAHAARQVRLTQAGEMFKQPGGRAMRFTTIERFAIDHVGFSWEARFPIAPIVSLNVSDRYAHGRGTLRVRALGFPLQNQSGPEIDVAEAYRYLAELPWVPHAMAMNHELEWRELDEGSVEVATSVGHERPIVRFEFDAAGDIVRGIADARPLSPNGDSARASWGGDFSDHAAVGGIRMPIRAEVHWDLPERRFVY